MKIEGPYKSRKDLQAGLKAYIAILKVAIIIGIILAGAHVVNQLDKIMADQRIHDKTMSDCMDQLMWIRQDIDALKDVDEPKIVDSSAFYLTLDERDLVERIVMAEAGNQPIEGMAGVAQVIRDRSITWGQSITDVCLAPGQFAKPYTGEISAEVVQAVSGIFDEGLDVLEVPTTHFHADYVHPHWTDGKVSRGKIGRHEFYGSP